MRYPIIHKSCGAVIAHHVGEYDGIRRAASFVRLDGTSPEPGDIFREYCPHCQRLIVNGELCVMLGFPLQDE